MINDVSPLSTVLSMAALAVENVVINVVLLSIINQHNANWPGGVVQEQWKKCGIICEGLDYKNQIEQDPAVSNSGPHPQITQYYLPLKTVNI